MRSFVGVVIVASSVLALVGCPGALEDRDRFTVAANPQAATATCDAPALLQAACASCHSGANAPGDLHLDSADAIDALSGKSATHGGVLIQPGASDKSVLYAKMSSPPFGSLMPPSGMREHDLACVRSWIDGLAPTYDAAR